MKRLTKLVGILGATAVMAAAGHVRADSLPAIAGSPFLQSDAVCFTKLGSSNSVTNTGCSGTRTWLIPMVVKPTVQLRVFASARGTGTAPTCRAFTRSGNDGSITIGSPFAVGLDTPLGNFGVTDSHSTGHVDCLLTQNGKGMGGVRWVVQ